MEPRGPKAAPGGDPVRVTSLNPVRDAKTIGHDVGTSRAVLDAKSTALRHRFVKLLADGESAAFAATERDNRVEQLLAQLKWAYDGIADDIAALEAMKDERERRDQILRETLDELAVMAELSTGGSFAKAKWRDVLDALRGYTERLISDAANDAVVLADIDLALERIERIEKLANEALRSYLGYLTA